MLPWLAFSAAFAYTVETTPAGAVMHWHSMPVPWVLDLEDAPPGMDHAAFEAVRAATETWEQIPGTEIRFDGAVGDVPPDAPNLVRFEPEWAWDDDLAALTLTTAFADDGRIVSFQTLINGELAWGVGHDIDLQSAVSHELGHALGVDHSAFDSAVMYAVLVNDELRRDLHDDDELAAQFLYPDVEGAQPLACTTVGAPNGALLLVLLPALIRRRAHRR